MLFNFRETIAVSAFVIALAIPGHSAFAQQQTGLDTTVVTTTTASGTTTTTVQPLNFSLGGTPMMTLAPTGTNGGTLSIGANVTSVAISNSLTVGSSLAVSGNETISGSIGIGTAAPSSGLSSTGSIYTALGIGIGTAAPSSGLSTTGNITAGGSITSYAYYHSSDARLKTSIHTIDHALDKLLAIKGVQFNWKKDGRADMGIVAQNVAEVFPDVVSRNSDGIMSVEYDSLVGPMIEAIRELKHENDDLRQSVAKMDKMQAELNQVSSSLQILKHENDKLRSVKLDDNADAYGHESLSATP